MLDNGVQVRVLSWAQKKRAILLSFFSVGRFVPICIKRPSLFLCRLLSVGSRVGEEANRKLEGLKAAAARVSEKVAA